MAHQVGVFRIGRDAEVRVTQSGKAVASLSLAYNYGPKNEDGKRASQWIDASLWDTRAETLSPYLLKGTQIYAVLSDIHIETYQKNDGGSGTKLVGRVQEIELISSGQRQDTGQQAQQQPRQQAQQQRAPQRNEYADATGKQQPDPRRSRAAASSSFDDMDDEIPF